MKWHISAVVVISLSLLFNGVVSNPALLELKLAISIAKRLTNVISSAQSAINMANDILDVTHKSKDVHQIMMDRVDKLEVNIPEDIQQAAQIDGDLREIFNEMSDINFLYNSYYRRYLDNDISNTSLNDFITKSTSIHADGPSRRATKIYTILCPGELGVIKGSFLDRTVQQLNTREHHRCSKLKSPQQYIYELWMLIGKIEFEAFSMISSGFKLRDFASEEDNALDIKRANEEHDDRMTGYITSVKKALSEAMRSITRCHPIYNPAYRTIGEGGIIYFNLMWVESNYWERMVVTGVRYFLAGEVLHVQIEESKLMPNGEIEAGSNKWKPIIDMRYDNNRRKVVYTTNGETVDAVENQDYGSVGRRSNIYFHGADVINSRNDQVVVGVRLRVAARQYEYVYYLELLCMNFEKETGGIHGNSNYVQKYDKQSTAEREKHRILIYSGNFDRVYFDSNSIYGEPRLPLAGIGMYQQPDPDHNPAVAFRIFNRDLASDMSTEL